MTSRRCVPPSSTLGADAVLTLTAVPCPLQMIDIIETVYRGASKGRGLVVSPKGAFPRCSRCRVPADPAPSQTTRLATSTERAHVAIQCNHCSHYSLETLPRRRMPSAPEAWRGTARVTSRFYVASSRNSLRCTLSLEGRYIRCAYVGQAHTTHPRRSSADRLDL